MYIYTYVYVHTYVYIHIHIYWRLTKRVSTYTHMYMYIHMYTYIHIYTWRLNKLVPSYTHMYMYIHMYIYIYIYTGAWLNLSPILHLPQDESYDLDLTYVTPRMIAMAFPAEDVVGQFSVVIRNKLATVKKFLDERHDGRFRVFNLCAEKTYSAAKFDGKVTWIPCVLYTYVWHDSFLSDVPHFFWMTCHILLRAETMYSAANVEGTMRYIPCVVCACVWHDLFLSEMTHFFWVTWLISWTETWRRFRVLCTHVCDMTYFWVAWLISFEWHGSFHGRVCVWEREAGVEISVDQHYSRFKIVSNIQKSHVVLSTFLSCIKHTKKSCRTHMCDSYFSCRTHSYVWLIFIMNEYDMTSKLYQTYKKVLSTTWLMSHIWMSHTYEWVRHGSLVCVTWLIHKCDMTVRCHVTHMNESCHTYEWIMSHIWGGYD